jgi:diaminopimelate epimerase
MQINFQKYQGTGNDFIILDNWDGKYTGLSNEQIAFLCNRKFGIGADGLMMIQPKPGFDFEMLYYNADGREGSMCGNGGRCMVAYAKTLKRFTGKALFVASDGPHEAVFAENGWVELKMKNVETMEKQAEFTVLNTGSPHYIKWVKNVKTTDVFYEGKSIRNSPRFVNEGINVNFVEAENPSELFVRTYERGVEDETLSCGTGITAAAIAASGSELKHYRVNVSTPGGKLMVKFDKTGETTFNNIWLCGPAEFVFAGTINI